MLGYRASETGTSSLEEQSLTIAVYKSISLKVILLTYFNINQNDINAQLQVHYDNHFLSNGQVDNSNQVASLTCI